MVSRSYVVRMIEPADRAKNDLWINHAEERGDLDEAAAVRASFSDWEKEQGFTRERLVCAVCGNARLSSTSKGTARAHRRDDDPNKPTWDTARRLREDIKTLQAELDRVLDQLERDLSRTTSGGTRYARPLDNKVRSPSPAALEVWM
jgi:hypothetical protein